jgi:hypothetical protein
MTSLNLTCPDCEHRDRIEFRAEDTFMSLGAEIGPSTYELRTETEMSAFDAARFGWAAVEFANQHIERLVQECERLSERLAHYEDALERHEKAAHGPFVASLYRPHFHRLGCKWAEPFLNGRHCQFFETHEEAVQADKKPCKTCRA